METEAHMNRRDEQLDAIAQQHLRVETLAQLDAVLDDLLVWKLRNALRAAYAAGMEAAARHCQHSDEARALRQVEMTRAPR
jgi:hypothetical protein